MTSAGIHICEHICTVGDGIVVLVVAVVLVLFFMSVD